MSEKKPTIIFAVGGSGGHLFAAQSLAKKLKEKVDVTILFVGSGVNSALKGVIEVEHIEIMSPPLTLKKPFKFVLQMVRGTLSALRLCIKIKPVACVGFGSYHSVTALLGAYFTKVPIILFESNVFPGKVVRLFSRVSLYTATVFKRAKAHLKGKVCQVAFSSKHAPSFLSAGEAKKALGLEPTRFTFLIVGGSQGASFINDLMMEVIQLPEAQGKFQVIHIVGKNGDAGAVAHGYSAQAIRAHVTSFAQDMGPIFAATDACISRSGALSILEQIEFDTVSILIPFAQASENHQMHNALFMQNEVGCSIVFSEKEVDTPTLLDSMVKLTTDQALFQSMQASIKAYRDTQHVPKFEDLIIKEFELKSYVLAGIGGIGMSSLAHILLQEGITVLGIDQNKSGITDTLRVKGATIHIGSDIDLPRGSTLVVSSAIKKTHPLMQKAKEHNIPIWHRSELLKQVMKDKQVIAVAGTHGKTSTSGLLAYLLERLGLNPSFAIGGEFVDGMEHGNLGSGDLFVAEADESDGSFLNYNASGAIITNLETDHLDYWSTKDALTQGFKSFVSGVTGSLPLFYNSDDKALCALRIDGISYGRNEGSDLKLLEIVHERQGQRFSFEYKGQVYSDFVLPLLGEHQVMNALPCIGMALELGAERESIKTALSGFLGMKKRLEYVGRHSGVHFYKDYAHHPTATASSLKALRQHYKKEKITCLYQPHRFSRMPLFLNSKTSPFLGADRCILFDVFAAGEVAMADDSKNLLERLATWGHKERELYSDLQAFMHSAIKFTPGEVVVLMGAGSIHNWTKDVLGKV